MIVASAYGDVLPFRCLFWVRSNSSGRNLHGYKIIGTNGNNRMLDIL